MPGVPSNKACERCKKRHLKCDETRPHCERCSAAGVECPGYVQTRKFIDQGASVRRRYAPYHETHAKSGAAAHVGEGTTGLSSHAQPIIQSQQPRAELFGVQSDNGTSDSTLNSRQDESHISVKNVQMVEAGPFDDIEPVSLQSQSSVLNGLAAHPASDLNLAFGSRAPTSPIGNSISPLASIGRTPALENVLHKTSLDRPDTEKMKSSEDISPQRSEREEFQNIVSELMTGTEHEIAFLTRHFAEIIGPWLDLSDSGKFFSVYVPIRAINAPSLKYAIAALAAKQLGRVKGAKLSTGEGMLTSPATTEMYPNAQADWFLKAANYYYMAASDISNSTSYGYTTASSSAVLESPIEMIGRWLNRMLVQDKDQHVSNKDIFRKAEEMMATAALLTFYKLFDSDGDQWHTHLTGIRKAFDVLVEADRVNLSFFSHGIRTCFWNFARQDYLASYFTRCPTHLDPENLDLWRAAGISIDNHAKFHINQSGPINMSQEDQAANGICWLVSKVVNFLAQSRQSQIAQWTGSSQSRSTGSKDSPGDASQLSTNTWLDLCFGFQSWFEGVPETFRPCVRIEQPKDLSKPSENSKLPFPEVFYSFTTCAATMQHYHFGRIALLLNRPTDDVSAPSTAFDRLQGYREVTKEVEYRSRELCGIALGRPQGGVRIYMIPLLFAVGQCLESDDEHQIIVDLLRGVEADLGWAAEYAVQKLYASWNR
ncbi:hypothetical protein N7532_012081 [Penicillium argentinense]|uniref:Zn(2)-C6 fungal-type domain-containing protein n=1 Tax=Penicillium argentinense TaxID=1131581 RepID=A0A9W9JVF6_9EURO|nr:uncharacterized protein N7532_012081 [Penicillium argentinense]KAJ5083038.1 hypothetical protein N7532_012081 [Penicillium argentinense]